MGRLCDVGCKRASILHWLVKLIVGVLILPGFGEAGLHTDGLAAEWIPAAHNSSVSSTGSVGLGTPRIRPRRFVADQQRS